MPGCIIDTLEPVFNIRLLDILSVSTEIVGVPHYKTNNLPIDIHTHDANPLPHASAAYSHHQEAAPILKT
jgi:hypothetical protein